MFLIAARDGPQACWACQRAHAILAHFMLILTWTGSPCDHEGRGPCLGGFPCTLVSALARGFARRSTHVVICASVGTGLARPCDLSIRPPRESQSQNQWIFYRLKPPHQWIHSEIQPGQQNMTPIHDKLAYFIPEQLPIEHLWASKSAFSSQSAIDAFFAFISYGLYGT